VTYDIYDSLGELKPGVPPALNQRRLVGRAPIWAVRGGETLKVRCRFFWCRLRSQDRLRLDSQQPSLRPQSNEPTSDDEVLAEARRLIDSLMGS
jgi:hypothetical protein